MTSGGLDQALGRSSLFEIGGMVSVQRAESGTGESLVNCGPKRVSRALRHPRGHILSQFSLVELCRLKLLSWVSPLSYQTFHKLKQP